MERYRVDYCDINGVAYRLSIYDTKYSGAVTVVEAGVSPIILQRAHRSSYLGGVCPTVAKITLVASDELDVEDLNRAENLRFRVVHTRQDGDKHRYWEGFVNPFQTTYEGDISSQLVSITASDGLSNLQYIKFLNADGVNYGTDTGEFMWSYITVMAEALKKTGLPLPITSMVDIRATTTGAPGAGGVYTPLLYSGYYDEPQHGEIGPVFGWLIMWDGDEAIGRTLVQGASVRVSGGVNDGRVFTVDSWDWAGESSAKRLAIYVPQAPNTSSPYGENAQIIVDIPPPTGGGGSAEEYPDPLGYTYVDMRSFIDMSKVKKSKETYRDGTPIPKNYYEAVDGTMMTLDVLEYLCAIWGVWLIQHGGRWEIVRVNSEMRPAKTYSATLYDVNGLETGKIPFGEDVYFLCDPTDEVYMPYGHTVYTDEPLKRVGVKYNYRYKTSGDTRKNLIKDGVFSLLGTPESPWDLLRKDQYTFWPAPQVVKMTSNLPDGYSTGVSLKNMMPTRALRNPTSEIIDVQKGDILEIHFYENITNLTEQSSGVYGFTLYSATTNRGQTIVDRMYEAVNVDYTSGWNPHYTGEWRKAGENTGGMSVRGGSDVYDLEDLAYKDRFFTGAPKSSRGGWQKVKIILDEAPMDGFLLVDIVGAATLEPKSEDRRVPGLPATTQENLVYGKVPDERTYSDGSLRLVSGRGAANPELQVTGFEILVEAGAREDENNYVGYLAEQEGDYSASYGDIDLIHADELDDNRVGNIRVKQDGELLAVNTWDSWAGDFGPNPLPLVLAKSLLALYNTPRRRVDGAYVSAELDLSSRLIVEHLDGMKLVPLTVDLDIKRSRLTGSLAEIGAGSIPEDNTGREPIWEKNGVQKCALDIDTGLNTGMVLAQEVDVNLRSLTHLKSRWVTLEDPDLDMCPIGPTPLYWGAVPEDTLPDVTKLLYFPVEKDGDTYRVEYSNDGTGKYLMVYWAADLGEVVSIIEVENEESISGWVPLADVEINGVMYKGLRMEFATNVFNQHPKTFKIL